MSTHKAAFPPHVGHPDIIVEVDDALDNMAAWLPSYFADSVNNGEVFLPNQTIQIGWMVLKLEGQADGSLKVTEPDFRSMPIAWVDGASRCIKVLSVQQAVCEQLDVEPDFPSLLDPASVSQYLVESDKFSLVRADLDEGHSGWVVRDDVGADTELELMSLYQLALTRPEIVPFLALPKNAVVKNGSCGYEVSLQTLRITSSSNEFLARLEKTKW